MRECGYVASADSDISSTAVTSERQFICDWTQCGKVFSHPDNLRVHYRRHTDEKPHHCHHCEAAYRQKSGLKYHLEKVHGEKMVGRCGRKRKLSLENNTVLTSSSSNRLPSHGAVVSYPALSKSGEPNSEVEHRIGHTADGNRADADRKHTMLSKVKEVDVDVTDSATKCWQKSGTDGMGRGRRWSLPDSLSQDCEDNLENIDINDEWLLDEDDGFIEKAPEGRVAEEGDRDVAGSTSDTEPLDEDLCEELRKLSDAINSEVMSPHGLDRLSSPFGSPVSTAYGAAKSDCIGNVMPDVSASGLYRSVGSSDQEMGAVLEQYSATSPPQDSNNCYRESIMSAAGSSNMLSYAQSSSEQAEMVNGYLPVAAAAEFRGDDAANYNGNVSASEPSHLSEMEEPTSYRTVPFDGSANPWSTLVNSSRWGSDERRFVQDGSIAACSAVSDAGFGGQDVAYSNLWCPAENSQHWLPRDGLVPRWPQRHLAQPDVFRQHDWHMGRQGESAFSRSGGTFDSRIGFEVGRHPSPKLYMPHRADLMEVPPMSDHFADSVKDTAVYPSSGMGHVGSWPDLYDRTSHISRIGNGGYGFPRSAYCSPVQPDHFYLTSGYSGTQSHAGCECGIEAEDAHSISNSVYRIPPAYVPSWPSTPGFSESGESRRALPNAPQSSVLYNVVPRYY